MPNTPVVSRPFEDDPIPPTVNTLNQALLPTLNSNESAGVEEVNGEEVAD